MENALPRTTTLANQGLLWPWILPHLGLALVFSLWVRDLPSLFPTLASFTRPFFPLGFLLTLCLLAGVARCAGRRLIPERWMASRRYGLLLLLLWVGGVGTTLVLRLLPAFADAPLLFFLLASLASCLFLVLDSASYLSQVQQQPDPARRKALLLSPYLLLLLFLPLAMELWEPSPWIRWIALSLWCLTAWQVTRSWFWYPRTSFLAWGAMLLLIPAAALFTQSLPWLVSQELLQRATAETAAQIVSVGPLVILGFRILYGGGKKLQPHRRELAAEPRALGER